MTIETLQANWMIFAAAALAVLLVVWWLFSRAGASRREREYRPDVLDEGVGPAQRNQALIDAAPAAAVVLPPVMSDALGGMGEVVAMAAQERVQQAEARSAEPEVAPPPAPAPAPLEAPPSQPDTVPAPPAEPEIAPAGPEPEAEPFAPEPAQQPQPEAVKVAAAEPAPDEWPAPPQELPQVPQPEPQPPQPDPGPAPGPEPMPQQPVGGADDLGRIKGLGPKLQALLPTLGISSFAQIAALSEADLAALDPKLGPFAGRPTRDGWVEQAKYLAAGDVAGFEALFGKV